MDIFKGQNLLEFTQRFKTEEDCKKYLSELKWSQGFICRKCGHQGSQIRKDYSRTCNKCSDTESPSADTLFHKVKFGLLKAFHICFEMATTTKSLSALQVARRYTVRPQTARMFMHKVREAMKSSESQPLTGSVHVDEFVVGGKETGHIGRCYKGKKKKVVCALELTDSGKVKRFYAMQIQDFSSKSLRPIFDKHIDKEAKVTTDEWKGYRPIGKDYPITQIPSDFGLNFAALHNLIHQVKSWIRTTYSWVSKKHINRYLNEYSYRINRSQAKETIFHNLITRMVKADKAPISLIVCS
jgi:transposase-like protein